MIGRWLNRARNVSRDRTEDEPPAPPPIASPPNPVSTGSVPTSPGFARGGSVAGAPGVPAQPGAARSPFTPTQPVQAPGGLIGRERQLARAIAAIETERAHLAIFGERGHGKTSLANIVAGMAAASGYGVVRHACSAGTRFGELIGAVLDKVPARFLRRDPADPVAAAPGTAPWTVSAATAALERIRAGHLLVFIDEFDRLADADARRDMTELLKNVSDLGLRVSFVLIGVADTLGELLALHPSIHRSLVAIALPLLTDADLAALIDQGCAKLGLRVAPAARALLLRLSHHSPYYAQLLSLHATDATLRRGGDSVAAADVADAAALVFAETQHVFAVLQAQLPPPRSAAAALLYAAARAPCDGFGWFAAEAVAVPDAMAAADVTAALTALTDAAAGPLLRRRVVAGAAQFAFARVNLRNHVLLREAVEDAGP